MATSLFWFRNDLRLSDNPALTAACSSSDRLILLAMLPPDETSLTPWGFARCGAHRRTVRDQALQGLRAAVEQLGSQLLIIRGYPQEVIPDLVRKVRADRVFCESIAAPEEIAEIEDLRKLNLNVVDQWQSSLLDLAQLPFRMDQMPEVFTAFRQAIELKAPRVLSPLSRIERLPPLPLGISRSSWVPTEPLLPAAGASFPFDQPAFHGSEAAALMHLEGYFASQAPQSYKFTRDALMGIRHSTKLSPWLATGALSPRTIYQHLKGHEARVGANESTYWIEFELLWRDFFRFSSLKHGKRLFRARGLKNQPPPEHDPRAFVAWCEGKTGHALIDAGMRELAATGYLSNRMRQIVASYLVHELFCDWRAGAAWFESRLIDYDVCSNQGNWLYLAGRGADPRRGRRFDPDKQASMYDPDGSYRQLWAKK